MATDSGGAAKNIDARSTAGEAVIIPIQET